MALWCITTTTGEYYVDAESARVSPDGSLALVNYVNSPHEQMSLGFAAGVWRLVYPVQSDRHANYEFKANSDAPSRAR